MNKAQERIKWFKEARFGMFIHWGDYSVPGRGEWVMFQENIPIKEYEQYAWKFNPQKFNADNWVDIARNAGMKYMVLTTRHHDGFSLFDSKVSDFTSVKTSARRDFVAEYVKACRKRNIKIGFYYSLPDWRWPAFFKGPEKDPKDWTRMLKYIHAQVKELCTNYGKIDILWYDTMMPGSRKSFYTYKDWQSEKLNVMVRKYQPHILINNRSGIPEDFDTPEQHVAASAPGRPWESCMTINKHWGYFKDDALWKSPREIVHNLTGCVSFGGNYLLNVGPKPDGTIPVESINRLKEIGKWLKVNGGAIYGAGPGPFDSGTAGVVTAKGNNIYLIVHWWPGKELSLPDVKIEVKSAFILSTKQKVNLERKGERLILHNLPGKPPDPLSTVIVMKAS